MNTIEQIKYLDLVFVLLDTQSPFFSSIVSPSPDPCQSDFDIVGDTWDGVRVALKVFTFYHQKSVFKDSELKNLVKPTPGADLE